MKHLIDSNIVIYSASDDFSHLRKYITSENSLISSVSIIEVLGYHKLSAKDKKYFEAVFQFMNVVEPNSKIVFSAAKLRRENNLSVADAIIAATALENRLELVTRNSSDFKNIPHLKIHNPFS